MQIIANQLSAIGRLAAMAQLHPTEVYIYCSLDWLMHGEDHKPYTRKVSEGNTAYWDTIHKEWIHMPESICAGLSLAFTVAWRHSVVFCKDYLESLHPSEEKLSSFKIQEGKRLDKIDDRFNLTRTYGHEMLHTYPAGDGMSPGTYTLLLDHLC